jgi:anti-sigma regulatory factor (Ser/Thr protein kinase)
VCTVSDADGDDQRRDRVWALKGTDDPATALLGVRRWIAADLADLGEQHFMDTMLVAVELITNAYDHGGGLREVRVVRVRVPCLIKIEVADFSTDPPVLGRSRLPLEACRGRGVLIVDKLSRQWGMTVDSESGGKTVWADVGCDESPCPSTRDATT